MSINYILKIMHKIPQSKLRSTINYSALHYVPIKLESQLLQNSGNKEKHLPMF